MTSSRAPAYTEEQLDQAYTVLRRSGLILMKLDVSYGLVGQSEESIRRMYRLKGRNEDNPCVVPGNIGVLQALCPKVHPAVLRWIRAQAKWTPLSVIDDLDSTSPLWLSLSAFVRHQCSRNGSVAVFLNAGEFMDALVDRAWKDQKILTGSSGNLSGGGNSFGPDELARNLIDGVDLFIDHGVARYANPERLATTMIDLRRLQVIRRGINYTKLDAQLVHLCAQLNGGRNEHKSH